MSLSKNFWLPIIGLSVFMACQSNVETTIDETSPEKEEIQSIKYETHGEFDMGILEGRIYTNSYFGFMVKIDNDWDILLPTETSTEIIDSVAKVQGAENYNQLLKIQQKGRIPLISIMAEHLAPIPNVSNALEYLKYTDSYIQETHQEGYPRYISHAIIESLVGDKPFLMQTFTVEYETETQIQRNYCAQFEEYILTIITHYSTQSELNKVNFILDHILWGAS
jgi:hypothetical protein